MQCIVLLTDDDDDDDAQETELSRVLDEFLEIPNKKKKKKKTKESFVLE